MALIISVLSQKGGVGKSSLARLIAREYAVNKWTVRIADMDTSQTTSLLWNTRRVHYGHEPTIRVETYGAVQTALNKASEVELLIFDGAPASSATTSQIAKASDLIILPTGLSLDDLMPQAKLATEFQNSGILAKRICFILNSSGQSESEAHEARDFIAQRGFRVLDAALSQLTSYRRANDSGRAFSETPYPSARKAAELVGQQIAEIATQATKEKPHDKKQRVQKA
jgi:chromosome partitioning protein